ncbi:response regulator [Colwelliaceae bacterium 6471]
MLLVYLLDDEKVLCDIFAEYFHSNMTTVHTFTDAEQAICACKEIPPDIFFIDYRLPNITGDEVAISVSESIPKILMTGDLSVEAKYKFQRVISKPYHFHEIQKVLDDYI